MQSGKWITRIAVNTCLDRLRRGPGSLAAGGPAPADEEFILQTAQAPGGRGTLVIAKQIHEDWI